MPGAALEAASSAAAAEIAGISPQLSMRPPFSEKSSAKLQNIYL
jgi:hypothetical protein